MAKKIKSKRKRTSSELIENILPQNIVTVGERVEEDKNIYILQSVYKEIHRFTKNKTTNESGGMLIGSVIEEFGKSNIIINGFIEAKYCEATPTTFTFTHETWEYVHKEIEKKYKGKKIVGWIHTHPDFGIFLSEYDKFIHQNFFAEENQVAYVVDPIQHIEGFYFWINGKIEKCKGFYIYDKTGVNINVELDKEKMVDKEEKSSVDIKNILLAILAIVIVFLCFSNISTNNKLEKLEKQQETSLNSVNEYLKYMEGTIINQSINIENLSEEIKYLKSALIDAGIISAPNMPEDNAEGSDANGNNIEEEKPVGFEDEGKTKTDEDDSEKSHETSDEGGTSSE